jgi:predicted CopG family antitoxin
MRSSKPAWSPILIENQGTLPVCHFIWIGPPSEIDKSLQKLIQHDTHGPSEFAAYAKNPIIFYCLEEYADYYSKYFEDQGHKNISVKSVQSLIQDCRESKKDFLKSNAARVSTIFEAHMKSGTKNDFVILKDLFSILIVYNGGYTLDTNVKPIEKKPFSLPSYSDLIVPYIGGKEGNMDIWMLYAPAHNENVEKIILNFLTKWTMENKHALILLGVITKFLSNSEGRFSIEKLPNHYPWKFGVSDTIVEMEKLNLIKIYNNTHYTLQRFSDVVYKKILSTKKESLDRIPFTLPLCSLLLNKAIQNKNVEVINALIGKHAEIDCLITILLENILQKDINIHLGFKSFVETEEKEHLLTKNEKEMSTLIQNIFLWSIELHLKEYAKILSDEWLVSNDSEITYKVCEKNQLRLICQLIKNKEWNESYDISISLTVYHELLLLARDEDPSLMHFLLNHPQKKHFSPPYLDMLAVKLDDPVTIHPNFISALKKEENHLKEDYYIPFRELLIRGLELKNDKYATVILKKLPKECDRELLELQNPYCFQLFKRKRELVFFWQIMGSPFESPAPLTSSPQQDEKGLSIKLKTELVIAPRPVPILTLSESSLFIRRHSRGAHIVPAEHRNNENVRGVL